MIGAVVGLVVLAVSLSGLAWYLVKWTKDSQSKIQDRLSYIKDLEVEQKSLELAISQRDHALSKKQDEIRQLNQYVVVLQDAKKELADLLEEVSKQNPKAIDSGIRARMERLRALSQVPPAVAPENS